MHFEQAYRANQAGSRTKIDLARSFDFEFWYVEVAAIMALLNIALVALKSVLF